MKFKHEESTDQVHERGKREETERELERGAEVRMEDGDGGSRLVGVVYGGAGGR